MLKLDHPKLMIGTVTCHIDPSAPKPRITAMLQGRDGEVCGLGTGPLDVCDGRTHEQPAPRSGWRWRRRRGRGTSSLVAPLQLLHVERG